MTNPESCKGCWWQEGGRCYEGKPEREPCPSGFGTRSLVLAEKRCDKFTGKRTVLEKFFPADKLVIASEENAKL
jgi:hypothetical protein